MPDVTFSPGVSSSPRSLYTALDGFTTSAQVVNVTTTEITLTQGNITYVVHGENIHFTLGGSGVVFTSGTLTGIDVSLSGAPQMSVTGLGIQATDLQTAIAADKSGADNAAIENMFLPLGYTYHGNANADIFLLSDTSGDGIGLNSSGNDKYFTGGGADNIFLGDGKDLGHGGAGNDTFNGGLGNDKLYGEDNNDRLFGDAGGDKLFGGSGKDSLTGGAGADTMAGGTGIDTFVFARHDGHDRINGFNLAQDLIDLPGSTPHNFTEAANGTLLHYGNSGDTVLLVGIDIADAGLINLI